VATALGLGRDVTQQLAAVHGQLNLCAKSIDDAAVALVAAALIGNTSVNEIHLGSNLVGDAGAVALANVLASNLTVTDVNLNSNRIGDAGAVALAEVLTNNSSITWINLNYNDAIGESGRAALVAARAARLSLTLVFE
jgi:Ran GTPase-activating protein (RanGAP) involved in mRNA processing and transport